MSSPRLPQSAAELDELLMWSTIRVARRFEQRLTSTLARLDITPQQFGILAHLEVEPGLTQARLAQRVLIRPQSVQQLLGVLIDRGLVERTGPRGSGRPNPVRLTDEGRALLGDAWPLVLGMEDAAQLGVARRDAAALARGVAACLRGVDPAAEPGNGTGRTAGPGAAEEQLGHTAQRPRKSVS